MEPPRIDFSFTGTRKGMTPRQKSAFIELMKMAKSLHHGMCVGADVDAHEIAWAYGVPCYGYPSTSKTRSYCRGIIVAQPPKPPLERNPDIVRAGTVLIAAPHKTNNGLREILRSGTWGTVRAGRRMERPVIILDP